MPRVAVIETATNTVVNVIEVPTEWLSEAGNVVLPDDWTPVAGCIYIRQIEQRHTSRLGTDYVTYHGQMGDTYLDGAFITPLPEPPSRLEELTGKLYDDSISASEIKEMLRLERA